MDKRFAQRPVAFSRHAFLRDLANRTRMAFRLLFGLVAAVGFLLGPLILLVLMNPRPVQGTLTTCLVHSSDTPIEHCAR